MLFTVYAIHAITYTYLNWSLQSFISYVLYLTSPYLTLPLLPHPTSLTLPYLPYIPSYTPLYPLTPSYTPLYPPIPYSVVTVDGTCTALEGSFMAFLSQPSTSYYIELHSQAFEDMAKVSNAVSNIPQSDFKIEGSRDCSACPTGQFLFSPCTEATDRICKTCTSSCPTSTYQYAQCMSERDLQCKVCSSCKLGEYVVDACASTGVSDTVCSACTECSVKEYPIRDCSMGVNRQCTSCEKCTLPIEAKARCEKGKYLTWKEENCCTDSDDKMVNCRDVDRANIAIMARRGKQGARL